jgi:hypothetical protein
MKLIKALLVVALGTLLSACPKVTVEEPKPAPESAAEEPEAAPAEEVAPAAEEEPAKEEAEPEASPE